MSIDRLQRAGGLVDLRQRDVERAQALSAEATRAAQEAEAAAQRAQEAWQEATQAVAGERLSSVDLADLNAWQRTLRQYADHAVVQAGAALAEAERAREALVASRAELRKIEIWRDGLAAAVRAAAARTERLATDEVAARMTRRER